TKHLQQVLGKLHRLGLVFVYRQVAASMSTQLLIINNSPPGNFLSLRDPEQSRLFPACCLRNWLSGWGRRQVPPASEEFRSSVRLLAARVQSHTYQVAPQRGAFP